ncbi:hypothetical protein NKG95_29180 [Mesorhizobium sp. M1423]|uniref:hypothetical protein n=1 Tax=Mesorhizobium sp. M1423 TaxID=2957101 RepID=UPI00333CB466
MTVHYFLFAAWLVSGFHGLPICPAMLSAHGCIENRDIGDAAILDEQFLWNTWSSDVKTLWLARAVLGMRQTGNAGKGAPCGEGDMVKSALTVILIYTPDRTPTARRRADEVLDRVLFLVMGRY